MKTKHISILHLAETACVMAVLALCIACGSSKKAVQSDADNLTGATTKVDQQTRNAVEKLAANRQTVRGVRGKVAVSIGSLSASGSIKMKRDEIIQVQLSALLGLMEVGRLELTPEYLFVIDRINHEYLRVKWAEVPELQQAGINFYIFQALFWDELFLPGRTQTPEASEFTSRQLGEQLLLEPKDNANAIMALQFFLENKTGLVRQSSVTSPKVPSLRLDWLYTAWNPLDGKDFPAEMQMLLTSSGKAKRLQFKLSNMQVDEKMGNLASPQPGSNYTPMDVSKLLQKL